MRKLNVSGWWNVVQDWHRIYTWYVNVYSRISNLWTNHGYQRPERETWSSRGKDRSRGWLIRKWAQSLFCAFCAQVCATMAKPFERRLSAERWRRGSDLMHDFLYSSHVDAKRSRAPKPRVVSARRRARSVPLSFSIVRYIKLSALVPTLLACLPSASWLRFAADNSDYTKRLNWYFANYKSSR